MDGSGHAQIVDDRVPQGKEYRLVISYKPDVDEFHCDGLAVPPWIAIGMLHYMEILVRRRDAENMIAAAQHQRGGLIFPGGHR